MSQSKVTWVATRVRVESAPEKSESSTTLLAKIKNTRCGSKFIWPVVRYILLVSLCDLSQVQRNDAFVSLLFILFFRWGIMRALGEHRYVFQDEESTGTGTATHPIIRQDWLHQQGMKVLEFSEDHDTVDRLYLGGGASFTVFAI